MQAHDRFGVAAARTMHVPSDTAGLAVRDDAMDHTPMRDVRREGPGRPPRALTPAGALDLRAKRHVDAKRREWDLVDLTDLMPATDPRVGQRRPRSPMTQDTHFGWKVTRTGAAGVPEVFGDAVPLAQSWGQVGGDRGREALGGGLSWDVLLRLDSNQ